MKESQKAKLLALQHLRKARMHGKTKKVWSVYIRRTHTMRFPPQLHVARFTYNLIILLVCTCTFKTVSFQFGKLILSKMTIINIQTEFR